jgi:hypothetical protein
MAMKNPPAERVTPYIAREITPDIQLEYKFPVAAMISGILSSPNKHTH